MLVDWLCQVFGVTQVSELVQGMGLGAQQYQLSWPRCVESWLLKLCLPVDELDSLILGPFHGSMVLLPVTGLVWMFPAEGESLLPGWEGCGRRCPAAALHCQLCANKVWQGLLAVPVQPPPALHPCVIPARLHVPTES